MLPHPDQLYAAMLAHDSRYDGLFYVGVTTTGVYCRPVCRVRTPGRDRCRFYAHPAAAEADGFRPCLRCRPELAPGNAPVDRSRQLAERAFLRIQAGALHQDAGLERLAQDCAISSRQLRRALVERYGLGPLALAQTQRLLLAKQLLMDTDLSMADIAFASGFGSVRRFNALFRARYRLTPMALRRGSSRPAKPVPATSDSFRLLLGYRPPLAWATLSGFLSRRGGVGVEALAGEQWRRTVRLGTQTGWMTVQPARRAHHLEARISLSLLPVLTPLLERLRGTLDLAASPVDIDAHLSRDAELAPLIRATPGLRIPGALCGFELATRAVLGQQVSVAAATTLYSRLVSAFGETLVTPFPDLTRLAPRAEDLAEAGVARIAGIGLPRRRAETLQRLAREVADGQLQLHPHADAQWHMQRLADIPGIGPWTTSYIAMRALGQPDAFPHTDLGLRRRFAGLSMAQWQARTELWRPWRAYAAMHIWTETLHSGG